MLNCRSAGSQALPSAHEHTPRKTPLGERPFFLSWCVYALQENTKYSFEVRKPKIKTHLQDWTKVTSENCWRQGNKGLQGSYKFLEPNFKTFSRLFFKTKNSFYRLKVIKWVINRDLEKRRNQSFLMIYYKGTVTTGQCGHTRVLEILIVWLNGKKSFTYKALPAALVSDFLSIFQTFPGMENCYANFKTFFKNSRLCMNSVAGYLHQIALFLNRTDPSAKQKITGEQGQHTSR